MHSRHRSRRTSHVARSSCIGPCPWKVVVVLVAFAGVSASMAFNPSRVAADSRAKHRFGMAGIQITDLDPELRDMNVSVDYYRQDGFGPITTVASGIPWTGSWNVYLPSQPELENGVYSAVISADRRIRSSVRIDWMQSAAASMYTSSTPSEELVAPLVRIEPAGHRSLITVQNTSEDEGVEFELALFAADTAGIDATAHFTVAAGLSRTIDLAHDPAFGDLLDGRPAGFVGSARIRSTGAPVTAHVLTEGEPFSNGVYDYAVEPVSDYNRKLHIPRFRVAEPGLSGSAGTRSTSVAVGNPSDVPIEVVVTYSGTDGVCTGRTVETGPHNIPPWSSTILDSALDSGLSSGCAGYATLTSDGPATAVIVDRTVRPDRPVGYSAHPALTVEDASTLVVVPLIRNRFLTGYDVTTETVVTNPGGDPATVTLVLRDDSGATLPGPCDACSFSLASHESRSFNAAELGYPAGSYGSIMIRSDQPVAAIDHDISLTGSIDSVAFRGQTISTRGVPDPPSSVPGATPTPRFELSLEYLPLVVKRAEIFGLPEESGCLYFPAALRNVSGGTSGS